MAVSYKEQPVLVALGGILLVVLTVFVGVKTWNAAVEHKYIGKPATVRDTITIQGEGKVTSKPTLALVQFGVVTQSPTPAQAQAANTAKMNTVTQAMKDLGIKEDDLETSGYALNPNYDYSKSPMVIQGYILTQNLSVKVRDFDKVGTVLERGVALGINQVNTVQFTIDEPAQLREQARMEALEDAKKRAEALARALGVDIVRVVSFSESGWSDPGPTPMYYGREAAVSAMAPAPSIQSGTQDVQTTVSVTYEIR